MLDISLQADPIFFPSLIFAMYYSLQLDDTARALSFFKRAKLAKSENGPDNVYFSFRLPFTNAL